MPVTLDLAEPTCRAALAKLQAGLAARVAVINAEPAVVADGIAIETPAQFFLGGLESGVSPNGPAVIVSDFGIQFEAGAEGPHSFVAVLHVGVIVYEMDTSREALAKKVLRQARAVTEVLWDDEPRHMLTLDSGNTAYDVRILRHDPGPVFRPTDERSFYSAYYAVVFACKQLEG